MTAIAELDNRPSIILVVDPPSILPVQNRREKTMDQKQQYFSFYSDCIDFVP